MTYPNYLKPDNPRFLAGLFVAIFILILAFALQSCSHVKKTTVSKMETVDSTNVKHESTIDIRNNVEDSSNASNKSIENNTDSSNTKTVTVLFDKDTSGKQTEISINVDSTGSVNIKTNKPIKSVNATQKQANKKQEKQTASNASHSKKTDTNIKASDKGDSTNKKADIKETNKEVDKSSFSWSFLWWLIPLLVIIAWLNRNPVIDWLKRKKII